MKTLVIMPTYNESGNIEKSVELLFKFNQDIDLLIVDDNSPDGTGRIAEQLSKQSNRIHVLHREGKSGLGAAYLAGFDWGFTKNYEFLVEMDADGSHRAEDLPKLIAVAPKNDLVIGSRYVSGGKTVNWPFYRQWLSRGGNIYARLMLGGKLNDMTAGFRIFRSEFLKKLDLAGINARGYSFQIEMAYRTVLAKGRVAEVPITFVERAVGTSKMSSAIVLEALILITKFGFRRLFRRTN
ncbi:MAG: polyprenol monophosphomannose synthase [Actinobacteria bacterium]|nr:polyprenol monophosphomannose synthase [Actinomycetota bacterium]NDE88794.1 polyprenol monophosphomannose synthase [Micrococcales bacterium]